MTPFFITGYPRSRTAWLSVALTNGRTTCLHDVAMEMEVVVRRLAHNNDPKSQLGISDPSLLVYFGALSSAFPQAPWVLVNRIPAICMMSLCKVMSWDYRDMPLDFVNGFERVRAHPQTLTVNFSAIDNRIQDIAIHCGVRLRHDIEALKRLNIQVKPDLMRKEVAALWQ
jgi:hypothetical protein